MKLPVRCLFLICYFPFIKSYILFRIVFYGIFFSSIWLHSIVRFFIQCHGTKLYCEELCQFNGIFNIALDYVSKKILLHKKKQLSTISYFIVSQKFSDQLTYSSNPTGNSLHQLVPAISRSPFCSVVWHTKIHII